MELQINEDKFFIEKLDGESQKIFDERIEFIKKVYKDNKNFKEAINFSKVWVNFIHNDCRYSPEVFRKLKKYLD